MKELSNKKNKDSISYLLKEATQQPLVATVILNYNGEAYLSQFLPTVLRDSYPNQEVIVADNKSTDTSIPFLQKQYLDTVKLLVLNENYGFAKGYNEALKQVEASYYILLNSDVEVTPNWIAPIIELMEKDPNIAACQPKVLAYHDKSIFEYAGAAGGWMDNLGYPFCRGRIMEKVEKDDGQYDTTEEVFWATGAALVIRGPLYHAIGGLDGDYFAHMEEIDLCWRLKRAGYKIMVEPKSVVYHVGGGTLNYQSPRKTYLNFRNSLATIFKNEPTSKLLWLIPTRLILDGVAGGVFLLKGQFSNIWAIIRAHLSFYANFGKLLKKRRAYTALIEKNRIGIPTVSGRFTKSIIWQFYIRGKKTFKELIKNK